MGGFQYCGMEGRESGLKLCLRVISGEAMTFNLDWDATAVSAIKALRPQTKHACTLYVKRIIQTYTAALGAQHELEIEGHDSGRGPNLRLWGISHRIGPARSTP